ncbi:MAG: polyribonucleotide nucleotidyltransferase [Myxococcota bacterium]
MAHIKKSVEVDGKTITFETGKIAKQASGSCWVTAGGTALLVTANASKDPRDADFLPLTVEYQEKMSAAGRIPGSFFRREARPREDEILQARITDRSIRPRFPEGWRYDTQVICTVFSYDPENPPDALALCGAAAALEVSDIPFDGPIAGVRVCRVKGELKINPSQAEKDEADLDLFVSCSEDAVVMVEGGGRQVSEQDTIDALLKAHEACKTIIAGITDLGKDGGQENRAHTAPERDAAVYATVKEIGTPLLKEAYSIPEKLPRYAALDVAKTKLLERVVEKDSTLAERTGEVKECWSELKHHYVRETMLETQKRIDERGATDIRPIETEVSFLARTHGSALFTRGETQAIVTATLGTRQDEQRIDDLTGDVFNNFLLHYNFPPYSVGESRPMRSTSRREIGHGALALRALKNLIDIGSDDFPYTVRVVSDVTESNGSSSMATVCGGSMAMMDAGVPMDGPCAGIAMGLIKEGDSMMILSDILGDEDHLGDMDFKVAGTDKGITAIQMDIKIAGVTREVLETALEQARQGRLHILGEMAKSIQAPRTELSEHAPKILTLKIKQDKIRDVIGPGGKVIRDIVARTGAQVNVEDDGTVTVAAPDGNAVDMAVKMVRDLTQEAEVGKLYMGNVRKITDFGAFVEIFPGTDGLIHISELAPRRVKRVEDVLQEGDEVLVKVIGVERGKVKLSRKQAIADEEERQRKAQGDADEPEAVDEASEVASADDTPEATAS